MQSSTQHQKFRLRKIWLRGQLTCNYCNPVLTYTIYVQEKEKFRGLFTLKSLGSFGLKIALRYHCFVTGPREGEVKLVFYINLLRESLNIDINSISLCTLITSIISLKAGKPAKSVVLADTVCALYSRAQSICKISLETGKPAKSVVIADTVHQCTVGPVEM